MATCKFAFRKFPSCGCKYWRSDATSQFEHSLVLKDYGLLMEWLHIIGTKSHRPCFCSINAKLLKLRSLLRRIAFPLTSGLLQHHNTHLTLKEDHVYGVARIYFENA